jgi:hypothetical protein
VKVALAADTVSIAVMEVVDNAVMLSVPGAMEAGISSCIFWGSLAFASRSRSSLRCRSTAG